MLLNYSVKIKSLNNKKIKILKNFIELKNNNKNFKKFIIIKSPFKYKKSREQYGLNYVTYIINLKTIQLNCKFFELFFFKFF
jgi:ribosomal protein S10